MDRPTISRAYVLNGKIPVPETDLLTWAGWFDDHDRVVVQTELPDDVFVSTVFTAIDVGFRNALPMLFETMIFGGSSHGFVQKYATWEEAEAGHAEVLALMRRGDA